MFAQIQVAYPQRQTAIDATKGFAMKTWASTVIVLAALILPGCELHDALMGFREPNVSVAGALPIDLSYREAKGGIVILTGRVNGKADVDFILDTGAPVSVLIDGRQSAALGLDTRKARPLGDADNPATPVGVIQGGFHFEFGAVSLSGLTAAVIAENSIPCRDRFEEINFGGVIGADLFRKFVVEIDPVARRVRLHDPRAWRAAVGATILPLTLRGGHPFVDTKVTLASGKEVAGAMNLDIGMNRALTLAAGTQAIAMPTEGDVRKSCYVNGTREERIGPAVTVTLGDTKIAVDSPVYSQFPNLADGRRSGSLGIGLFKGRRLTIDYPGRRVIVG
jgi:Aspartyl protease